MQDTFSSEEIAELRLLLEIEKIKKVKLMYSQLMDSRDIDALADRQIAAGLDLPAAFQPAIAMDPMTSQHRGWNPALALWAAKTRKVVIGMGIDEADPARPRSHPAAGGDGAARGGRAVIHRAVRRRCRDLHRRRGPP